MKSIYRLSLLIVWILLFIASQDSFAAQPFDSGFRYLPRHLSVSNGLSQNSINDFAEDNQGNIWIATFSGLNRFDGVHTRQFFKDASSSTLAEDEIIDLEVDQQGRLWVLSKSYLLYGEDGHQFLPFVESVLIPEKGSPIVFQKVFVHQDFIYLYHSQGVDIYRRSGEMIERKYVKPAKGTYWFAMNAVPFNEHLLIATSQGLFLAKDGKLAQKEEWPTKFKSTHINDLIVTQDGVIVMTTYYVAILDSNLEMLRWSFFKDIAGIKSIFFAEKVGENLFFAMGNTIYQADYLTFFTNPQSGVSKVYESKDTIYLLMGDREQGLWMGTSNGGAYYLSDTAQRFKYLADFGGQRATSVIAMTQNEQFDYWATSQSQIFKKSKAQGSIESVDIARESLSFDLGPIGALYSDGEHLWIGSSTRLVQLTERSGFMREVRTSAEFYLHNIVRVMRRGNRLWGLSGVEGLFYLEDGQEYAQLVSRLPETSESTQNLRFLDFDIVEDQLIASAVTGQIVRYQLDGPLLIGEVIYQDKDQPIQLIRHFDDNIVWMLTQDGLFEFQLNTRKLSQHLTATQIGQKALYSLIESNGLLWIGGSQQLIAYEPLSRRFFQFGGSEGALDIEYNARALVDNSRTLFATVDGIVETTIDKNWLLNLQSPQLQMSGVGAETHLGEFRSLNPNNLPIKIDASTRLLKIHLTPKPRWLAGQIEVEYQLNQGEWRKLQDWSVPLYLADLDKGDNQVNFRSSWFHQSQWMVSEPVVVLADKRWTPKISHLLMICGMLLLICLFLFWRYRKLAAEQASQISATVEQTLAEEKLRSIAHDQQQSLNLVKSESVNQRLLSLLTDARTQISDEVLKSIFELNTRLFSDPQLFNVSTEYLPIDSLFMAQSDEFSALLPAKLNRELKRIDGKVAVRLFNWLLAFSQFYLKQVGLVDKYECKLEKMSLRKAEFKLLIKPGSGQSKQIKELSSVFDEMLDYLRKSAAIYGLLVEIRANDSLLEWQWQFPSSQKGMVHWISKSESARSESTSKPSSHKLKLYWLNLTEQQYTEHLFSDSFQIQFVNSLEQYLQSRDPACGLLLISIKRLDLNQAKPIAELLRTGKDWVVICYEALEQPISQLFEQPQSLVALPQAVNSLAVQQILRYFGYRLQSRGSEKGQTAVQSEPLANDTSDAYSNDPSDGNYRGSELVINENSSSSNLGLSIEQSNANTGTDSLESVSDNQLKSQLFEYLEQYCADESLDTEKLAFAIGLSSRHLNRKLKLAFGCSAAELIRNYRLDKGYQWLEQGYTIEQIRKMSGFSSRNYFSTCFKKRFGINPSELQKSES